MSRERNCTRRDVIRWVTGTGVVTMGDAARAIGGIGSKQRGNLAAAQVSAAAVYSAKHRGHALLVKQHGRVIHESYSNGAKASTARRIYSGTKGFWGLAALAAMEDGLRDWE